MNTVIPAQAVEAAAKAMFDVRDDPYDLDEWGDLDAIAREPYVCQARAALKAAAPYIRAQALEDAKDALNPGGSYVLQNIAKWLSERAATERTRK